MIGIIFATEKEAKPFLVLTNATLISKCPILIFKPSQYKILPCLVVISGIGKVSAAIAALELILKYKVELIINAGICGQLKGDLSSDIGEIYRISISFEGDRRLSFIKDTDMFQSTPFFQNIKEATLVTIDKSVFNNHIKQKLSLIADLVDMEGAVISRISNTYNINCDIIKGVSDFAKDNSVKMMKLNINKVSLYLAEVILDAIRIDRNKQFHY